MLLLWKQVSEQLAIPGKNHTPVPSGSMLFWFFAGCCFLSNFVRVGPHECEFNQTPLEPVLGGWLFPYEHTISCIPEWEMDGMDVRIPWASLLLGSKLGACRSCSSSRAASQGGNGPLSPSPALRRRHARRSGQKRRLRGGGGGLGATFSEAKLGFVKAKGTN